MSLLLDALKQAEVRKRADRPVAAIAAADGLEVELDFEREPAKSIPEAAQPLDGPGVQAILESVSPPAADDAPAPVTGRRRGSTALALGAAVAIVLAAVVFLVLPAIEVPQDPAILVPPPDPAILTPPPMRAASLPPTLTVPPVETVVAASAAAAPAAEPALRRRAPAATATQAEYESQAPTPVPRRQVEITSSRRAAPLMQAYEALRRRDFDAAERLYREVLADEPHQVDALLGVATVAEWRGDEAAAAAGYRQALAQDPRNAVAWAGLTRFLGESSRLEGESRLKGLIADRPSAALHFALGNLQAQDQRWADAQTSYFDAHAAAPDNADYAFNLAIALDRLGQHRAAAGYYRRAVALAAGGSAVAFDPQVATARVQQLDPGVP